MADRRKKELDDLQKQINSMQGDDDEDFDYEGEMKKLKERQRAEENQIRKQNADAAQIAMQFGVNPNEQPQQGVPSKQSQSRPAATNNAGQPQQRTQQAPQQQQQQQRTQAGKHSEDLAAMINNMKGGDDNEEVIVDAGYKQRQAELKREMQEMEKASKQFASYLPAGGNDQQMNVFDVPEIGGPQAPSAAKQLKQNEIMDNLIQQDQVYSKSTDMNCVTVLAQEFKLCDQYLEDKSLKKLCDYFSSKKEELKKNVLTLNNLYLMGKILPQKYVELIEKSLFVQEGFRTHFKEVKSAKYSNRVLLRIGQMKKDILQLKQNPIASMEAQFKEAMLIVEGPKKQEKNDMSSQQMLNALHDQLSLVEKVKLMSKLHKHFFNLAIYFKSNIPEKEPMVRNFFQPILANSKDILDKLKAGKNEPIASFLANSLQEVTPEFFHGQSQSQFEAGRQMWVERLEQAIKQEYDIQKIASGQKRALKGNEMNDQSVMRMNEYVFARDALKRLSFNQYIPFPKIEDYKIALNFSLDNKAINKNQILITIKRLIECKSDKYQVNYSFTPGTKTVSNQTDWCDASLVFDNKKTVEVETNSLPLDLYKKKIDIILYKKGLFSNSEFARGSISLQDLETNNQIDSALLLSHKGHNFSLEIRTPLQSSSLKESSAFKFKFYDQFKLQEGVDDYISKNVSEMSQSAAQQPPQQQQQQPPRQQQQQPQQQPQQQAPTNPQNQQMEEEPAQAQEPMSNPLIGKFFLRESTNQQVQAIRVFDRIPAGLTAGDLLDLENPQKFQCLPYLKFGYDAVDDAIKTGEYSATNRRAVSKIRDKFLELSTIFEMNFKNEKITAEDYYTNLQEMLDLNMKILWVFRTMKLTEWESFARARHQIIMHDFKENFGEDYEGTPYNG